MRNLFLIGMMGSGKTVTGRALADLAHMKFVDLDSRLQDQLGTTINEVFQTRGEPFFREQETLALREVCAADQQVVSTGGGIILLDHNVRAMKEAGPVIYLKTSLETLWKRVQYAKDRPLLNTPDPLGSLTSILESRRGKYEHAADLSVETDGKSAAQVAQEIWKQVKEL